MLRSSPLIRYDRSLGGGKQADRYLRAAGIVPQERFELSSLLGSSSPGSGTLTAGATLLIAFSAHLAGARTRFDS